ncbi:MAG: type IV pilus modification protein PilV [Thiothrix sp.]|uniref:type IV pilus modification protein PilV n=1 Tax=Thiothrix sp. TaxID=1032 RepID=UPI0026309CE5|nr:type IV pilus modification protein PilV [Thiothrix sp.]MDD5393757.1 type IV pilus modification protein PilV [Thiothrix sp.]
MMRFRSCSRGRQAGLSLLEVLIAALVLSIGLLGLASLQIAGMKTTHNSYQMQQATWMVQDLLERMRANKPGAAAGDYNVAINACGSPPTCLSATACTSTEMAKVDLYQVKCGSGSNGGFANELMNGVLTVACVAGGCTKGVNVSLRWDERNAAQKSGANIETFTIQLNAIL